VDVDVELIRELRPEIVAPALRLRAIDDADRALQPLVACRTRGGRIAKIEPEPLAAVACIKASQLPASPGRTRLRSAGASQSVAAVTLPL